MRCPCSEQHITTKMARTQIILIAIFDSQSGTFHSVSKSEEFWWYLSCKLLISEKIIHLDKLIYQVTLINLGFEMYVQNFSK